MSSFETIVVGAGSAGGIVATRLAEREETVLLIEAGPDFPSEVPELLTTDLRIPVVEYDWGYESEGDRVLPLPRGKVVGGSSAVNAVAAIRPQPADFDAWGMQDWTWDACLPAMCRFETDAEFGSSPWHGNDGPVRVERPDVNAAAPVNRAIYEACLEVGYKDCEDMNAPGATGAGPQPYNALDGARQSTLVTFLRRARTLPSFTLRPDTMAERIVIERGRARGIEITGGGILRADRIIISAGAYATPLLLMRSGIGPAAQLKEHGIAVIQDLPVGETLIDHPALPGVLGIAKNPDEIDTNLLQRFMARVSFDGRDGEEDVHIFGPFTERAVRTPMPPGGFVVASFHANPRSRGTVKLRSADPSAPPRVTLNYFADESDVDVLVKATHAIHELFAAKPLANVTEQVVFPAPDVTDEDLRMFITMGSLTDHHPHSTCPAGRVLDARLKVHGLDNLYVCDASAMPGNVRANTNLPTMTLAERFVELL